MSVAGVPAMVQVLRFRHVGCLVLKVVTPWLTCIVDRILSEQRRLKEEEKNAEALLAEYQQKASEALARLTRVRKQKESLVERGVEMVARGLSNLEELEQAERQESEAALDVQLGDAMADGVDWSLVFADFPVSGDQEGPSFLPPVESAPPS